MAAARAGAAVDLDAAQAVAVGGVAGDPIPLDGAGCPESLSTEIQAALLPVSVALVTSQLTGPP